jgi:hypothetical protein
MAPKDVAALKKSFIRQGFADEIDALEAAGKAFAAQLSGKEAAAPSQAWKLLHSARPEAVLWAAHHVKAAGVQNKLKSFYTDWPQARQRIPFALMQEMRITPDLPGYDELVEKLFFELMDNHLSTVEEQKAYLEPYSPPAPPPPVHLRRARAGRKEPKAAKSRKKAPVEGPEEAAAGVQETTAAGKAPAAEKAGAAKKAVGKKAPAPAEAKKAVPAKAPAKKAVSVKKAPAKPVAKKAPPKPAAKKASAPAKKAVAKKAPPKVAAKKAPPKPVKKPTPPAKKAVKKAVAKKKGR